MAELTTNEDPLIPCLKQTDQVLKAWKRIKANPVNHNAFRARFSDLSVELDDLCEIWGDEDET